MAVEREEVSFSGTYTPENARMARWALRRTDRRGLVGGLVGLVLILLPFVSDPPIRGLNALIILAAGACILFLFWVQPEIRAGGDWKRLKKQIPVSGSIGNRGLEFQWDESESKVSWSSFRSSRVTPSLLLLEDSAGRPTYLPRAFFATETDWKDAVEIVTTRVAGQ